MCGLGALNIYYYYYSCPTLRQKYQSFYPLFMSHIASEVPVFSSIVHVPHRVRSTSLFIHCSCPTSRQKYQSFHPLFMSHIASEGTVFSSTVHVPQRVKKKGLFFFFFFFSHWSCPTSRYHWRWSWKKMKLGKLRKNRLERQNYWRYILTYSRLKRDVLKILTLTQPYTPWKGTKH